jgi:hypothetical protein
LFIVSIEREGSRRVYDRGPLLSDLSQLGNTPYRRLARADGSAHRCWRTNARSDDGMPNGEWIASVSALAGSSPVAPSCVSRESLRRIAKALFCLNSRAP